MGISHLWIPMGQGATSLTKRTKFFACTAAFEKIAPRMKQCNSWCTVGNVCSMMDAPNSRAKLWKHQKHRICLLHAAVVLSESLPTMTLISRDVIGNCRPFFVLHLSACPSPKNVLPADPASEGHFSVVEPKEATRQSKCLLLKNYLGDAMCK